MNFWTNAPFCIFYNMIVKTSQQWFKINGKNAFRCPLRLGLYLKVECINLSETNFSITAESHRLWQGAICHVWTSQFDKHWWQSQKQLQKYNIRDVNHSATSHVKPHLNEKLMRASINLHTISGISSMSKFFYWIVFFTRCIRELRMDIPPWRD